MGITGPGAIFGCCHERGISGIACHKFRDWIHSTSCLERDVNFPHLRAGNPKSLLQRADSPGVDNGNGEDALWRIDACEAKGVGRAA